MVMLGAVLACDSTVSKEAVWAALPQVVKSRPELIELNKRAINAGIEAANAAVYRFSSIRHNPAGPSQNLRPSSWRSRQDRMACPTRRENVIL